MQTKKIAGRIIPAISTTTSVVAGLASLELFKLAQADRLPLSAYRNAFINLAGPFFALTEPFEAAPVAMGENGKASYTQTGYNIYSVLAVSSVLLQRRKSRVLTLISRARRCTRCGTAWSCALAAI